MTTLANVTEIKYLDADEELRIKHELKPQGEPFPVKNNGHKFRAYKEDDVWKIDITATEVTEEHTEIKTRKKDTKITFVEFNTAADKVTLLEFIGIQDMRDGANSKMEIAFGLSPVSIKTTDEQLIIRKEHYT